MAADRKFAYRKQRQRIWLYESRSAVGMSWQRTLSTHTGILPPPDIASHNSRRACHLLSLHCIAAEADGPLRRICSTACCVHVEQPSWPFPWDRLSRRVRAEGVEMRLLFAISHQQRYLFQFICTPRSLIAPFILKRTRQINFTVCGGT